MSEFPTLQAMGLNDINSISHYKLSQGANTEELKVYFKQQSEADLPDSSSFHFERNVVAADSEAQAQKLGGSDPVLVAAISELNSLSKNLSKVDRRDALRRELDRLEQVMTAKIQELRENLDRI
ncbi:MAG: DUF3461 family protein [Amphritea sp.]|nr:DUF3461 family protein [Amphritea sp.]